MQRLFAMFVNLYRNCLGIGDLKCVKDAKIALYSCPFDMLNTETKGTVLINNAKELLDFSTGEENLMDEVKAIDIHSDLTFVNCTCLVYNKQCFFMFAHLLFSYFCPVFTVMAVAREVGELQLGKISTYQLNGCNQSQKN